MNEIATSMQTLDDERQNNSLVRNQLIDERKKLMDLIKLYDEKVDRLENVEVRLNLTSIELEDILEKNRLNESRLLEMENEKRKGELKWAEDLRNVSFYNFE
jgi:hypothetical protein